MFEGRLQDQDKLFDRTERKLQKMPEFATEWYWHLRASDNTAGTCCDYIYKLYRFLNYMAPGNEKNVSVSDFNSSVVDRYCTEIRTKVNKDGERVRTSNSYQNGVWNCLNNLFEYLVNEGKIDRNYIGKNKRPSASKDLPRINENRILLTEKDFKKILRAVDDETNDFERIRDKAILEVLMSTGMRRTALITMMIDDVDFEKGTLNVIDKGDKTQIYYLTDNLSKTLKNWLNMRRHYLRGKYKNEHHLFISNRKHEMGVDCVEDVVKKYSKKGIGKAVSPHKIRSGVASIMYNKTKDIRFVQQYIGHADISTTQRYIVSSKKERREGASIMDNLLG